MMYVINFLGGLAMFLFAMKLMSDNLNSIAGNELKGILKKITSTPYKGVLVGLVVTAITQSSTATQLMTMGLVNSKIMTLLQAIGVNMGADIGTTLTGQMIAFKISHWSYLFVLFGVILLFIKKSRAMERWSMIILSFGLLFIGLDAMSGAVSPLRHSDIFSDFMIHISHNPILTILTGVVVCMIINSSTGTIGIVMALAMNGLVPPVAAMYIVLGANIGTNSTGLIASLSLQRPAKRVALFCMMYNVIGVSIFSLLTYLGFFDRFICFITTGSSQFPDLIRKFNQTGNLYEVYKTLEYGVIPTENVLQGFNIARFIANAHTFYNVTWCILVLPFAGFMEKFVCFIIKDGKKRPFRLVSLNI